MITNPPYGIRLGERKKLRIFTKNLVIFSKQSVRELLHLFYTGEPSLRKHIGLKTSRRIHLVNGKLEGVLLQIESYEGSRKKKYQKSE